MTDGSSDTETVSSVAGFASLGFCALLIGSFVPGCGSDEQADYTRR